jgi:hypothetical protein
MTLIRRTNPLGELISVRQTADRASFDHSLPEDAQQTVNLGAHAFTSEARKDTGALAEQAHRPHAEELSRAEQDA